MPAIYLLPLQKHSYDAVLQRSVTIGQCTRVGEKHCHGTRHSACIFARCKTQATASVDFDFWTLAKIPRLHLYLINVAIRIIDIARLRTLRQASRIETGTAMVEFIAASMWQRKGRVAIADTRQRWRQIGEVQGDEMHDLAFPLDTTMGLYVPKT